MLIDSERKVFTILCNYFNKHRSFPDFKLLQVKTNKSKDELIDVLTSLAAQSFIDWNNEDINTVKILRFLEQSQKSQQSSGAEQVDRFFNEY